jgi:hypothetical protein
VSAESPTKVYSSIEVWSNDSEGALDALCDAAVHYAEFVNNPGSHGGYERLKALKQAACNFAAIDAAEVREPL